MKYLNSKSSSILGPIKKANIIIVSAIFLILICFLLLNINNKNREQEDKILINTFGKQRMYTQMLSKDANQLYAKLQIYDKKNQSAVVLEEEISFIKNNIKQTREEFAHILQSIRSNSIQVGTHLVHMNTSQINRSENLMEIEKVWALFDQAVQQMLQSNKADSTCLAAVNYINDHNMELLNLSDKLLTQLLDYTIKDDKRMEVIAYTMIGLLFVMVLVSLFHLQRYIIRPFHQLYKGITDIGLNEYPLRAKQPTRKKVLPIVADINDMFLKINYLISLIENINNNDSFMETLDYIKIKFSSFIPYNYIGIALINQDEKLLKASYGVTDGTIMGLPDNIVGATWPVSDTSLEAFLKSGEARIINDLERYCEGKPLKPYNKIILEAGVRASIALPLKVSGEAVGMIFFSSKSKNVYNEGHLNFLSTLANSIAISLNKNIFTSEILYSSILALAKLSEARDEDTGEHMERMAVYSRVIAQLLYDNACYADELTIEYIDQIERFSPLHDIGKVGINDGILLKPGKLTPEEFYEMKKHTVFGAEVLRTADRNLQNRGKSIFGLGIEIAEGHHEKWDGSGYPYQKKGKEIPLSARIVAVADVFDALTSKRPYKEAFSLEKTYQIIEEGKGNHFDPVIVDLLFANRNRIDEIYHRYHSTYRKTEN